MRKYSIVINELKDDLYALVIRSWELDKEGNKVNIESSTETGLTFTEIKEKINNL